MADGPAPARADASAFAIKVPGFGVGVGVGVGTDVAVAGGIGVAVQAGVSVGTSVTLVIPTESAVGAPTRISNQGVLTEQPARTTERINATPRERRCQTGEANLGRIQSLCACSGLRLQPEAVPRNGAGSQSPREARGL